MFRFLGLRRAARRVSADSLAARVAALGAVLALGLGGAVALASASTSRTHRQNDPGITGSAAGLGQLSGLLPRSHLTEESALQINLSNETARLPIYPGVAPVPVEPPCGCKIIE